MDSTALAITLAGFGGLLLAISYRRHRYHRNRAALAHALIGSLLIAGGAFLLALALNYNTYQALQSNTPLAEVSIKKLQNQRYQLSLMRVPSGDLQVFTLQGNNWRINARVLTWKSWLRTLGLRESLRLEQLIRSSDESPALLRRYALNGNPGINLWEWRQSHDQYADWLDLHMLESATAPLEDGARFHITLLDHQLQVRPINRVVSTLVKPAVKAALNDKAVQLLKSSNLQIQSVAQPDTTATHATTPSQPSAAAASQPSVAPKGTKKEPTTSGVTSSRAPTPSSSTPAVK